MHIGKLLTAAIFPLALAACGGGDDAARSGEGAGADGNTQGGEVTNRTLLEAAAAGGHRTAEERMRDSARRPVETLIFFGVEPGMTVVEVWPGGGWYTQIIAPYLKSGGGKLIAAGFDLEGANERVRNSILAYRAAYVEKPEIYGEIEESVLDEGHEVAPEGSMDVVLTFRNVHNWLARDRAEAFFAEFYRVLKPGGVLGVVEHRADGVDLARDGSSGYVFTDDVIHLAEQAGFEFESASEINANLDDTKDHPFGVWTLPPVRRSSEVRGVENPDFDRAKYDAIGESDRMTLKFRKPLAADGALYE